MFDNPLLQKISSELRCRTGYARGSMNCSDASLMDAVLLRGHRSRDIQELGKYFLERKDPHFFLADREEVLILIRDLFSATETMIAMKADKIRQHVYDLLGSGDVQLGSQINWHCDFKENFCWALQTPFADVRIPYDKADIKVPWELSRFHEVAALGKAYVLTQDEKYSIEFITQITDWIHHNPPGYGVNWRCSMEVAIRACNWILGYSFFKNSPYLTQEFLMAFLKSIYQHAKHIENNLEYSPFFNGNHYLADIIGLVYIGVFFPEFRESTQWKKFGIRQLKQEMQKQVYADGCNFEASTMYHRLALELFFYPTLLVVINDGGFDGYNYAAIAERLFGKPYVARLYKMFEALLDLLKPDGTMPQLGDNDNGRLHIMSERELLDLRYLLVYGAIFFNDRNFKIKEFGNFCEEAAWIFGRKGREIWDRLEAWGLDDINPRVFPNAGWAVMRAPTGYVLISCGPNGQKGNGGHAHNDKLSFEWFLEGQNVIVDPGTYVYTSHPDWRNRFRSVGFHNTVVVDREEQNRFDPAWESLFRLRDDSKAEILQWQTNDQTDIFIGRHKGYARGNRPVVHQRKILWNKKTPQFLEITDTFLGVGEHVLTWNFHVLPEVQHKIKITADPLVWRLEPSQFSPSYGQKTDILKRTAEITVKIPFNVKILIRWA